MNPNTGEIFHLTDDEINEFEYGERKYSVKNKRVMLTEEEFEQSKTMGLNQRKAWMRNISCVCGSGKKFKKCCWSKFK